MAKLYSGARSGPPQLLTWSSHQVLQGFSSTLTCKEKHDWLQYATYDN